MSTNTKMAEALQDGLSVCNSVSMAAGRRVVIDGCVLYAQTEEWCQWAKKEVRPRLQTALNAHDAEQSAKAVPADPCVVLWQAMNEAEKVGNRTDDKLIVWALRRAGYCIAAISEQEPCHDAWRAALAQRREPLTDEQIVAALKNCEKTDHTQEGWIWRTRIKWARAIEAAHGIGATTGEQHG